MGEKWRTLLLAFAATPWAVPHGAVAQDAQGGEAADASAVPGFDIDRAFLADRTIFQPFRVESTEPLREALKEGRVGKTTPLLVMEHEAGRLALVTDQMAYHHVAQGEIAGEPWMVSF
ncbi:MAG: hypothetical protein ACE5HP_04985 [Gemmatimonadota bacterium]